MADIAELAQRVALIDQKVDAINRRTDESNRSQSQLIKELHELTSAIRVMTEKQGHVEKTAERIWTQHEALTGRVQTLELFRATNEPIINGVRDLNKKVVGMVFAALLAAVVAPFATATYVLKQLPEPTVIRHEQTTTTPRDPK